MNDSNPLDSRRQIDQTIIGRMGNLEYRIEAMDDWIRHHIEKQFKEYETIIADRAATLAIKRAFSLLGVDVDDPKDMQTFRDDLRFGGVFRNAAQKGFLAIIAAVFGGIGLSFWLILKEKIGLP